ncbi:MAG: regulatory protein RecX [Magnetococcales bacterium]|nr:regulatory protein RecX [Magnetococcales bacterium]
MEPSAVYHQAVAMLARRPFSIRELTRRLLAKGADEASVEQAIRRCRELGYLNDADYALNLAKRRLERRGPMAIRAEMRQRGIDEEEAREALHQAMEGIDLREEARRILEKRFGETPPADARERRRRQAFLARRGFDGTIILELLQD